MTVEVPGDLVAEVAYEVEICADETCHREVLQVPPPIESDGPVSGITVGPLSLSIDDDIVRVGLGDGDWSGTHTVSAIVRDGADVLVELDREIEFSRSQPNGPDCPPTCWFATVPA